MSKVYENCPVIEGKEYIIRLVENKDVQDLLMVYSDKNALPFSIVIIAMEIFSTMIREKKCLMLLSTGGGNMIENALFGFQ